MTSSKQNDPTCSAEPLVNLPSHQEITDKVVRTVAAHLGVRHTKLAVDSHLRDDLQADFLDRIELAITVEEQFGVRLPLEELVSTNTVSDLIELLKRAMKLYCPQNVGNNETNINKE